MTFPIADIFKIHLEKLEVTRLNKRHPIKVISKQQITDPIKLQVFSY